MNQTGDATRERYLASFEEFERSLNGDAGTAVHGLRKAAIRRFGEIGFPTGRHEEWRFTNIAPITHTEFAPVPGYRGDGEVRNAVERLRFPGFKSHLLVFVNGHYAPDLSSRLPSAGRVVMGSLADMLRDGSPVIGGHLGHHATFEDNAFTALNTAFLRDGACVIVPERTVVEDPIFLLFMATGEGKPFLSHPRNLLHVGAGSQVSIIERYVGLAENEYLTNAVTELVAGEEAVIEHDKMQDESTRAYHISSLHVFQDARSTVTSNAISFGGRIVRNNVTSVLAAEGCECTLNGLSLATRDQLIDNHTTIDHAQPHCNSHELYKAILDGQSRGVFNGKIFVRQAAQKTDAKQTNKTLLLSDTATIDTKPQLEIFADDVKCTHGATVGQLDEEQVFYLRSRGLSESQARDMLTFAFAGDVVERVHVGLLREQLDRMVHERLERGRKEEG